MLKGESNFEQKDFENRKAGEVRCVGRLRMRKPFQLDVLPHLWSAVDGRVHPNLQEKVCTRVKEPCSTKLEPACGEFDYLLCKLGLNLEAFAVKSATARLLKHSGVLKPFHFFSSHCFLLAGADEFFF